MFINELTLPGTPVPAARPRVIGRHTYDPKAKHKVVAKRIIADQWHAAPLDGPLSLDLKFFMPQPKSWSGKRKNEMEGKPHISRPDADNLAKHALDIMNEIVYCDDSSIFELNITKVYSKEPRTMIRLKKCQTK